MNTLEPITTDIWGRVHRVNAPGGLKFDSRMVVVRLPQRELLLYSPIPIDDALGDELEALGEVTHIVAPNGFHHLFASAAKARWPQATLWASPGVREKGLALVPDRWLGEGELPAPDTLEWVGIGGAPKLQEWDFLHRPSETLVVCDLVFHIQEVPNLMTRFALWMAGAGGGRLAQSRLLRTLTRDREALARSAEAILALPSSRLVPGHGAIIEDAQLPDRLREVLWWMRGATKPARSAT